MLKCFFTYEMSFGKWLRTKRQSADLSQERLADLITKAGHTVTGAYISMIEREYDKNKKGLPTRVNEDLVECIAGVLGVEVDEARVAANYAPQHSAPPTNAIELIEALERLGIPMDHVEPFNLSPEDYGKLLDDIRLVVALRSRR